MTERGRFRQADITKAIRGAVNAGMQPTLIRIHPDGEIEVGFGSDKSESHYDRWKRQDADSWTDLD